MKGFVNTHVVQHDKKNAQAVAEEFRRKGIRTRVMAGSYLKKRVFWVLIDQRDYEKYRRIAFPYEYGKKG